MNYRFTFLLLLFFFSVAVSAQAVMRGSVRDADNGQMLVGATVQLQQEARGTTTDSLGLFRFDNIRPGRYAITISYLGYQQLKLQEILVSSGKEQVLDVRLQEAATSLTAITVKASRSPQNNNSSNLLRLSQEETLRFPATFNDPARLALAYPGLSGANDQANHLVVRGQSPLGMQWRLEGLEIANPNHTPNAGTFTDRSTTSGGGVNALSSQLLEEANFYLGSFPTQFSNATAGLMDMRLRKGNDQKREYTFQAGLIGFDLAAEGPFRTEGRSSYLVNYRYSFTGLLSDLGVSFGDEDIRFQDLSYQLSFPATNGRELKIFGLSGTSSNEFASSEDSTQWETDKELYREINYRASTYSHGFSWTKPQKNKGLWRIAGMASWSDSRRLASPRDFNVEERQETSINKNSLQFSYRRKLLPFGSLRIGSEIMHLQQKMSISSLLFPNPAENLTTEGWVVSPYVNWQYQIKKVNLNLGYRAGFWGNWLEQSFTSEPRLSVAYSPTKQSTLSVGYSVSSQAPSPYVEARRPRLVKQWSAAWTQLFTKQRKLSLQLYSQALSQFAGVGARSEINQLAEFIPNGQFNTAGRTRGAELSLQQFAMGGWWYVLSASVFDARYQNEKGEWVKTRYAQDYASAVTLGKEWSGADKDKKINRFGFNIALRLNGGLRSAPIALAESTANQTTVFDYSAGFSEQLPAYFRTDLRIYFQKNNPNWSSMLSLDIQNVTGRQNPAYDYYDRLLGEINTRYQLEFIPIMSYRINF